MPKDGSLLKGICMISKSLFVALIGYSSALTSLDIKPWFGDVYACSFEGSFAYADFPKVEGAQVQLTAPEQSRTITLDLGATPFSYCDFQMEGEFGQTNHVNWALRSAAFQIRLRPLNDIVGDPCSLVMGVSVRAAPTHFLKDVSTPYAAQCNLEFTTSVGKEFSLGSHWTLRTYGFLALGQANRGYPWIRPIWVGEYKWHNRHQITLFVESNIGCGGKQGVDVNRFNGWGRFQHQSIDVGGGYGLKMGVWGTASVFYARRVFAHNFPMQVNSFIASYSIPFSVL
jgi:hypothetical protein